MSVVKFKHANNGAEISLFIDQIFGVMTLKEQGVTGVVGPGNAIVPVSGSHEEVTKRINDAKQRKEEQNNEQQQQQ